MSFVTDEIVEAAAMALYAKAPMVNVINPDRYLSWGEIGGHNARHFKIAARAALTAAAPLWLAHVRAASEHTADYQMAAAAAEIEKGLTT